MSRCFPYPPPGYAKNGIHDETLIESIKLQREGEKAKKEKKKEKRRHKKKKEKALGNGKVERKKQSPKKRHRDETSRKDQKGEYCQKSRENEIDHLEKSSLTEEHGHPVGSESSYDSTHNSNKRQKLSSASDARHNSGSVIRIRLPPQRHKNPEMVPSSDLSCGSSVRNNVASVQQMDEHSPIPGRVQDDPPCSTSGNQDLPIKIREEKLRLPIGSSEHPKLKEKRSFSIGVSGDLSNQAELALPSNLCGSCSPPSALKFRDLVENWVPPQLQIEYAELDDQDWLFEMKHNQNDKQRIRFQNCDIGTRCGKSNVWPQSCYLPAADVHALPFTVPF